MENNNKLIAEFMGLKEGKKYLSPSLDAPESIGMGMYVSLDEMRYHTSWDWLMPVVEQIESLGYCYDRIDADVFINKQSSLGGGSIIPNPMDHNTMTMLEKTYCVVVQFIKYYNQNN